jgi:undecaprenyl-diphosphatase
MTTRGFAVLLSKHRVESRILLFFMGLLAVSVVCWKAASEVLEGDTMAFDRAMILALRDPSNTAVPIGPTWFHGAMVSITAMGSGTVLTLITVIAAGYLIAERKPAVAAFTVSSVAAGALLGTVLKSVYSRARPDVVTHLVGTHSASFPSGHAMNSAVVYLTLAVLIARTAQDRRISAYLIVVAIVMTLVIGFSRVYLGVHWPTDVVAGWCVGGLWAMTCSLVAKSLQSARQIERAE